MSDVRTPLIEQLPAALPEDHHIIVTLTNEEEGEAAYLKEMAAEAPNGSANGDAKPQREPMEVVLVDENGQPTPFLRNAPFLDYGSPMTALEWAKAVLLAPLAIARATFGLACLLLVWVIIWLALVGEHPKRPLPKWKEAISRTAVKMLGRAILFSSNGGRVYVKGWDNLAEGQRAHAPLIFNHVSYLDALVLAAYFAPCGVAKADVATMPIVGTITRGLQFLFVARSGTTDRENQFTIRGNLREEVAAREVDPRFPSFMIAPEGTTKPKHCLLRYSVGGFAPGAPVQPVLLDYSANRRFNPGWGLDESTLWHFWRLLTQLRTHIRLEVLPIYHPSAEEKADPRLYAENVRRLMGRKLNAPLVNYGTREEFVLKTAGVYVDRAGKEIRMQKRGMAASLTLARIETMPPADES